MTSSGGLSRAISRAGPLAHYKMLYKCKGFGLHLCIYYDSELKVERNVASRSPHRMQLALAGQVFKAASIVKGLQCVRHCEGHLAERRKIMRALALEGSL